jgi:5-methylthioadenosine/S-adenosylhomocysteine deaminase
MNEEDIIIKNAIVIPVVPSGKLMKDAGIIIEAGKIVQIGTSAQVRSESCGHEIIDANNCVVIPGLINAHTHLPETLLRGICDDQPLERWLWDYVWVMEAKMTKKEALAGARLGCIELIKSGVTAFIDQFYYAHEIATAVVESGIRALLCPSVFDNNPEAGSIENCFNRACVVVKEWQEKHPRVKMGIGPHATYTVDKDMLLRIYEFAVEHQLPLHIHLSETSWELKQIMSKFGVRSPIQHLQKLNILENTRILGAHCVYVDERDLVIMQQHDFHVLHNPTSNLKLAAGIAPITKFIERGINVCIGTDGSASNNNLAILEEVMLAALLQKNLTSNPTAIPIEQALEIATINGAYAMGLSDLIGSIEVGKSADLTIIGLRSPHMNPSTNVLSNLIYASNPSDIRTVIVDGKIIMRERELLTLNETDVIEDANRAVEVLKTAFEQ